MTFKSMYAALRYHPARPPASARRGRNGEALPWINLALLFTALEVREYITIDEADELTAIPPNQS